MFCSAITKFLHSIVLSLKNIFAARMVDAAQVFSTQADETELVAQGTER